MGILYSVHCLKNYLKISHLNFQLWHFPPAFIILKLTSLVAPFDPIIQVSKTRQNEPFCPLIIFNLARFARNVE